MKTCSDCNLPFDHSNFCKKKGTPDGYSYYCRGCTSVRAKKYYNDHPGTKEKIIKRNNDVRLEKKMYVMEYLLAHPCDCGEKRPECLDFDHQSGKIMGISQMIRQNVSLDIIKQEITKCKVRCANCHRVRTAKQFGWYQWYPQQDSNLP